MEILIIGVIALVSIGAFIVLILQVCFWLSLFTSSSDEESKRKQEAYETYMKMKQDEFFLNDGYKGRQP